MSKLNHVTRGAIETLYPSGEEKFIPMPLNTIQENDLRGLISCLQLLGGWVEVKADVGSTGYMDKFAGDEPNGYGEDEYGRQFVQMNILIEDKPAVVRVFERYTDPGTVLVSSGNNRGPKAFENALDKEEFEQFIDLAVMGRGFKQSSKYNNRLTITLP